MMSNLLSLIASAIETALRILTALAKMVLQLFRVAAFLVRHWLEVLALYAFIVMVMMAGTGSTPHAS